MSSLHGHSDPCSAGTLDQRQCLTARQSACLHRQATFLSLRGAAAGSWALEYINSIRHWLIRMDSTSVGVEKISIFYLFLGEWQ